MDRVPLVPSARLEVMAAEIRERGVSYRNIALDSPEDTVFNTVLRAVWDR
jgi:hypothetical protein